MIDYKSLNNTKKVPILNICYQVDSKNMISLLGLPKKIVKLVTRSFRLKCYTKDINLQFSSFNLQEKLL